MEETFSVFERKILKKIYGEPNIVDYVNIQRRRWTRRFERMDPQRMPRGSSAKLSQETRNEDMVKAQ
ncbi:hypothetical protein Trydic_g4468 [Trypoxylus dichotomus]